MQSINFCGIIHSIASGHPRRFITETWLFILEFVEISRVLIEKHVRNEYMQIFLFLQGFGDR